MKRVLKEKIEELKSYGEKPIGVFGARASGKTVFFTSLYALETMQNKRNDIKVKCLDWDTKEYLKNNYKYIMKGEFPPRTDANTIHKINMSYLYQKQNYNLKSIDFAGELLSGIPDEYKNEPNIANYILKKQELVFTFFSTCGGILVFLEPSDNTEKALLREKEVKNLLSALQEQEINWRTLPLAIIITKWDKINPKLNNSTVEEENKKALNYIKNHKIYRRIYQNASLFSNKVEVFPLSSLGVSSEETDRLIKLSNPFNIFAPLTWIADYRNKIWVDRIKDILTYNIPKTDLEAIRDNFKLHIKNSDLSKNVDKLITDKFKQQTRNKILLTSSVVCLVLIIILILIKTI